MAYDLIYESIDWLWADMIAKQKKGQVGHKKNNVATCDCMGKKSTTPVTQILACIDFVLLFSFIVCYLYYNGPLRIRATDSFVMDVTWE